MSLSDARHSLRKLEFPFCAREALSRIEQICGSQGTVTHSSRQADIAKDLINEFVFYETDRRGSKKKKLTCVQELQLLEVLSDYLSCPRGNTARYAVFLLLFPAPCSQQSRSRLLVKLVSMAISIHNASVLMATTMLMRQLSCTSEFSLQLASSLVNDNFVLVPSVVSRLNLTPEIAPLFAASFLTAVTKIFGRISEDNNETIVWKPPPPALLKVVTTWLTVHPEICLVPLVEKPPLALVPTETATPITTPYVGLFRWTIFFAMYESDEEIRHLYNSLHFALLESLVKCRPEPSNRPDCIVLCGHMVELIADVSSCFCPDYQYLTYTISNLGQAVQIILHTNSLHGDDLVVLKQLEDLVPFNRLIHMIVTVHYQKKQKEGIVLHGSAIKLLENAASEKAKREMEKKRMDTS